MEIPSLVGHCSEVLRIILKSHQPPDLILSQYVRSKKYIGSFDRRFISELVFYFLRIKSLPEYILQVITNTDNYEPSQQDFVLKDSLFVLLVLIQNNHIKIRPDSALNNLKSEEVNKLFLAEHIFNIQNFNNNIEEFSKMITQIFDDINSKISSKIQVIDQDINNLIALRYGQQNWIIENLIANKRFNFDSMDKFLGSFLDPSPLTIRIENISESERIIESFRDAGIEAKMCNYSPVALHLSKRLDLNTFPFYKAGRFEVQDEGSQIISFALDPQDGENILDACAGAGGKSLHIASLQHDSGRIVSCDVELNKLKELNKRTRKCGYKSIETVLDRHLEKLSEEFSKVLIDAPCTGMGTIRRNPIPKWRLTKENLVKHTNKQDRIIEYYSQFVQPGGELLYSTCSILADENEEVVERFLKNHAEFQPLPIKPSLTKYGIDFSELTDDDYHLQLLPSKHGCDGFFMAKLKRIK